MVNYPFNISKILPKDFEAMPNIHPYLVASTASINVETDDNQSCTNPDSETSGASNSTQLMIEEIAKFLIENKTEAEVVIHIHGYNTNKKDFENWAQEIYRYITQDRFINQKKIIFIGYRWPSEHFAFRMDHSPESVFTKFNEAIKSLPVLFRTFWDYSSRGLILSFSLLLLLAISTIIDNNLFSDYSNLVSFIEFIATILTFVFGFVCCAVFLRATVYFRDNYRAVNYGVPSLVELIRQIDNAVVEKSPGENRDARKQYLSASNPRKIKLSFIGHSMGAFVTTNVIRILSDVFDEKSIQTLDDKGNQKQPSPDIGNVFSLGRLVLASPDIPIETIMPERANFLRSSLRRFEESYLFSNQGDIVLRVASTAANYLSFPAKTYDRGFRLGNVVVDDCLNIEIEKKSKLPQISFGVINKVENENNDNLNENSVMKHICIVSDNRQKPLEELCANKNEKDKIALLPIAALFTYFDCTDYKDINDNKKRDKNRTNDENKPEGILTKALNKETLSFVDCVFLIYYYLFGGIDVHGGYFQGTFGKKMIYGLAFLGFKDFLNSLEDEPNYQELIKAIDSEQEPMIKLSQVFSQKCKNLGIRVFLAPERYKVDVLGQPRDRSGY
jgi:Alpha/beta hydrolase of unknown function (DUF900)